MTHQDWFDVLHDIEQREIEELIGREESERAQIDALAEANAEGEARDIEEMLLRRYKKAAKKGSKTVGGRRLRPDASSEEPPF